MKSLAKFEQRRESLDQRLDRGWQPERLEPVLESSNVHYEVSGRVSATDAGGLGLMRRLVECLDLASLIDERVELLKRHRPFHESDHVLSLIYSMLCGERSLDGLGARRCDEAFLDAIGARRIPHPTTAGDFLRRFDEAAVLGLVEVSNTCSAKVWRRSGASSGQRAIIDIDGTIVRTTGECKERMARAYDGSWGYHPLVVSLANSQEILAVVNRPGSDSSNTDAARWMDHGIDWARDRAGFEKVLLRGDTAFSLTRNFDRWSEDDVDFVFGMQAQQGFVAKAESLCEASWQPFTREPERESRRGGQTNVRQRVVEERGFKQLVLEQEHLAEWQYSPSRAKGNYRMIALRKTIRVLQGQARLEDEVRYFFYVTNLDAEAFTAEEVVRTSNARCNQENLVDQLKNGVGATRSPSVSFFGNWAHMVIGALAWNLKTWLGLLLLEDDEIQARQILRMEFQTFVKRIILVTAQILHQGRRLVFRLLGINRWTPLLLRAPPWLKALQLA